MSQTEQHSKTLIELSAESLVKQWLEWWDQHGYAGNRSITPPVRLTRDWIAFVEASRKQPLVPPLSEEG